MRTYFRRATVFTFILGVLCMILADAAHVHATQVTVLPNGLTVLVHEDRRFPLVAIRLFVRAGSAHELPEQAGISHMLEHMVFKGTSARAPGEVAAQIEGIGGELNAATGFDSTMYIMDVPDEYWVLALEVLQDMLFQAVIDPDELESERQVVLSELDQGQDQPHRRLFQAIQNMIWAGTPYERPIIGSPETVQNISREDILAYIQSRYQPRNMLLVVCGNVHQAEVPAQAQRLFGNLSNQDVARIFSLPAMPAVDQTPQLSIERGPWRKAHFALALPIPGLGSIQSVGLDVLAQMLGGDKTSLLYRTFKHEQGIVDAISASAISLEQAGMLYIQAQLDPENVLRLWEGLLALLANLSMDSFAPEALERAKLNLENDLFQAKETLGGLASKLGYFQFHEHSVAAEQRYLYQIRHMDLGALAALIAEYVRPKGLTAAVFTPQPDELNAEEMLARLSENWPWIEDQQRLKEAGTSGAPDSLQREIVSIAPGRTLVLLPDAALPYTALQMAWAGGDVLLAPEEQGLAELTARAWTKGTKSLDAVGIQDFLADRAAQVSAGVGLEQFFISAHYPSRFSKDILPFFLELIREPAWAPEELDRAKKEQVAAIVRSEDQPVGLAFRHIFPFLFPGHPYGYQRAGQPDRVGAFTREQVAAFRERQLGKPWVLAVSGDFDREEMIALAQSIAEIEVQVPTQSSPPVWGGDREKILNLADRNQAHLFVVFPTPGLTHEDSAELRVLREILAGQAGLLFQDLRDEQGLAYAVSAFLRQDSLAGFLTLYIATAPERIGEALAGFQAALARLSKVPVSEAELTRAVNLLRGDYHRDRQPLMARAHEVSEALVRGLDPDHELRMLEQAGRLVPEDISALVETYLQWDKAYFMQVLP